MSLGGELASVFSETQVERWREVRELREFADDVAARIAVAVDQGEDVQSAERWLVRLRERAEKRDPLGVLPGWPEPPELEKYELAKHMRHVPAPSALR